MKEFKIKDTRNTIAHYWLSKKKNKLGNVMPGRQRILNETFIYKIKVGWFDTESIKSACYKHLQVSFLNDYFSDKKMKLEDHDYYKKLRFFDNGLEKRPHSLCVARLNSFIKLCNSIRDEGWADFEIDKKACDLRMLSAVRVLNFITDDSRSVGLGGALAKKFENGECPPFRVIDGHHRLACAIFLNMKKVPTVIYELKHKIEI